MMYNLNEIVLNDLYLFKYRDTPNFFLSYITNKRLHRVYNRIVVNFIDKILYKLNLKEEPLVEISAILDLKSYNNDDILTVDYFTKAGVTYCLTNTYVPSSYEDKLVAYSHGDDEWNIGDIINLTKLVEENIIDINIIDSLSSDDNTIKQMALECILNKIK